MFEIPQGYTSESNVNRIEEAQIVCLGEMHLNNSHAKVNAEIIDSLYRQGDLVLVEAAHTISSNDYSARLMPSQTKHVNTPMTIKGWDLDRPLINPNEINSIFIKQIKNHPKLIASCLLSLTVDCFQNKPISYLTMSLFAVSIFSIFCYTAIEEGQKMIQNLPVRNRHMFSIIDENLRNSNGMTNTDRRIFVIAGSFHFQKTSQWLVNAGLDNTKIIEELMEYLRKKKYFILTPN